MRWAHSTSGVPHIYPVISPMHHVESSKYLSTEKCMVYRLYCIAVIEDTLTCARDYPTSGAKKAAFEIPVRLWLHFIRACAVQYYLACCHFSSAAYGSLSCDEEDIYILHRVCCIARRQYQHQHIVARSGAQRHRVLVVSTESTTVNKGRQQRLTSAQQYKKSYRQYRDLSPGPTARQPWHVCLDLYPSSLQSPQALPLQSIR